MKQYRSAASLLMAVVLISMTNSCFASNIDSGMNSTEYSINDSSKVPLGDAIDFLMPTAI